MRIIERPYEVNKIYDNGGKTIDRYSIHILYDNGENYLICTSTEPRGPLGVFSRSESHQFDLGNHLGKEIEWNDLPESVKVVIIDDI